jgi:hypothetical protein
MAIDGISIYLDSRDRSGKTFRMTEADFYLMSLHMHHMINISDYGLVRIRDDYSDICGVDDV